MRPESNLGLSVRSYKKVSICLPLATAVQAYLHIVVEKQEATACSLVEASEVVGDVGTGEVVAANLEVELVMELVREPGEEDGEAVYLEVEDESLAASQRPLQE